VQAVARDGAHKVIFGSDGPWLHPTPELQKIKLLRLPPKHESLILGGNVLRLLRRARVDTSAAERSTAIRRLARSGGKGAVELGRHLPPPIAVEHEL
jgi:hypothetical protein